MSKEVLKKIILTSILVSSMFINNINTKAAEVTKFIYYNQGNYRDVKYCDGGKNVASNGCGATSLAVIASSLSDKKYTPRVVAPYICSQGHVGNGTKWAAFTDKDVLNKFELKVDVLFKKEGKIKGNAGKTYSAEEGNKIFNAIKDGKGVVLHIPGHYVAIGPHPDCNDDQVYYYQVSNSSQNGCYTPKKLFEKTVNYKDRCKEKGNCGWKAAFAYEGIPKIKVYFNSNGAKLGNDKYKLGTTNNILKASDGNKYYKTYKYTATKIDLLNYNGTTFKMTYTGMKNSSPVWNTKADGSGKKFYQTAGKHDAKELFEASGCKSDEDCSITLYAQWRPIKYLIHYVGNGATGQVYDEGHCDSNGKCGLDVYTKGTEYDETKQTFKHATNYNYNVDVMLRKNRFYKDGYTFSGWSESATGDVKYQDKDTVKNLTTTDGDIIYLYAQWTEGEDNNNISETEESDTGNTLNDEDIIDDSSNEEIEVNDDSLENNDEEGFVDEDYGDGTTDDDFNNIKTSPQTGESKVIIVSLICIISIFFIIYYKKIYYQY